MTHRNEPRWHLNRGRPLAPGRAWKKPTYWPCDVRCSGGVNLFRAFVRNLRTWLAMVREKARADEPRVRKYRCASSGADCSVVVLKRGNARGAKGAGHQHRDRKGSTGNRRNSMVPMEGGGLQWVARAV